MSFELWLERKQLEIPPASVAAVLSLAQGGATVPFIARYRKEQTNNLDEVAIRSLIEANEEWEEFSKRKNFVREQIKSLGKLDASLQEKIDACLDSSLLEDIYAPFKPKKKNRATQARDAGLDPLALWAWDTAQGTTKWEAGQTLEIWAYTYRNEKFGIDSVEKALEGARDILIERVSEDADLRQFVRETYATRAFLRSVKGKKAAEHSKFEPYFQFSEAIKSLKNHSSSHRYLAVRRGWGEDELVVKIGAKTDADDEAFFQSLLQHFAASVVKMPEAPSAAFLKSICETALKAHIIPSIETEVHRDLKQIADEAAIHVFSDNVKKILLSAPFGSKAVIGVDPGLRTGNKVAVVDERGRCVTDTVIFLNSTGEQDKATRALVELIERHSVKAIAVGNGTGGRETEAFLRRSIQTRFPKIQIVMISESGASIYSASDVAREEFPNLDITVRGAISIARRLQDPLSELIKVDPKSVGVGQYQHDVNQPRLKRKLDDVVDSCVNTVGVNLNTASQHLLAHVSGIGPSLAKSIVEVRGERGLFKTREDLKSVPRLSDKVFEQAAGFLRVMESDNPLDKTGVHPEKYPVIVEFCASKSLSVPEVCGEGAKKLLEFKDELKEKVGAYTFDDIVAELESPGRDPRDEFVPFAFREDIHSVGDLKKDMLCPGIITNVTNFGAFVDIGVHQDGLVHLSQLAERFVKDPHEVVSPGDRVTVRVMDVDLNKKQISLSLRNARPSNNEGRRDYDARPQYRERPPQDGARQASDNSRRPAHEASRGNDTRGRGAPPKGPPLRERGPARPKFANNPFQILSALKKDLK